MTTTAGSAVDAGGNVDNENTAPNTHGGIGETNNQGQQMDLDDASSLTALSLFKSQLYGNTSTNKRLTSQRQAYEDRLRSFHAVNYMFKPACLSPIICARFGWCNPEKDMLLCKSCNSALAILLKNSLSMGTIKRITSTYRDQIATGHKQNCPFRLDAEQALLRHGGQAGDAAVVPATGAGENDIIVVPTYLASVLPPETVELMEQRFPRSLLRARVNQFEQTMNRIVEQFKQSPSQQQDSRPWKYPDLKYSPEFTAFRPRVKLESNEDTSSEDMLSQATDFVGMGNRTMIALSILGWTPLPVGKCEAIDGDGSCPTVTMSCSICLARRDLNLIKESPDSSKAPDPVSSHRRYCPWVCGFPTEYLTPDAPIWKSIVTKLFEEAEKEKKKAAPDAMMEDDGCATAGDGDKDFEQMRQLLKSGLVSPEAKGKFNENNKRFIEVTEEASRPTKRPCILTVPEPPPAVSRQLIEELKRNVELKEKERRSQMSEKAIVEKDGKGEKTTEIDSNDVKEMTHDTAEPEVEVSELPAVQAVDDSAEFIALTVESEVGDMRPESPVAKSLLELKESDSVDCLPGVDSSSAETLMDLGLPTIGELGTYKFFLLARAMATMAETETEGGRLEGTAMNVDRAVTKDWETRSLAEISKASIEALEGIGKQAGELWRSLGVTTISGLAMYKPCQWAEAVCDASRHMSKTVQLSESPSDELFEQEAEGEASADGDDEHNVAAPNEIVEAIPQMRNLSKSDPVDMLPGIDPISASSLSALGLSSIEELAEYKFFLLARSISTLAAEETQDGRLKESVMNIDHAVTKNWEAKYFREMCVAPIQALEGIGNKSGPLWESLNVKTIGDLASFQYCQLAEAVCDLSRIEDPVADAEPDEISI